LINKLAVKNISKRKREWDHIPLLTFYSVREKKGNGIVLVLLAIGRGKVKRLKKKTNSPFIVYSRTQ